MAAAVGDIPPTPPTRRYRKVRVGGVAGHGRRAISPLRGAQAPYGPQGSGGRGFLQASWQGEAWSRVLVALLPLG